MKTEAAQVAAIIRAEIKKHGIEARVKSKTYSGGDSVDVYVTDVLPATREKLKAFVDKFQAGDFDGMDDSYTYRKTSGPTVRFAFVNVEYTDELKQECWEWCLNYYSATGEEPKNLKDAGSTWFQNDYATYFVYRILANDGPFWRQHKPRIQLAA